MPERSLEKVALKLSEETGEVARAINKNLGSEEITEECCDVIICAIDILHKLNVPTGEVHRIIGLKLEKWVNVYGDKK